MPLSSTGLHVKWRPPPHTDWNGQIRGYRYGKGRWYGKKIRGDRYSKDVKASHHNNPIVTSTLT